MKDEAGTLKISISLRPEFFVELLTAVMVRLSDDVVIGEAKLRMSGEEPSLGRVPKRTLDPSANVTLPAMT